MTVGDLGPAEVATVDSDATVADVVEALDDLVPTVGERPEKASDTIEPQSPDYQP